MKPIQPQDLATCTGDWHQDCLIIAEGLFYSCASEKDKTHTPLSMCQERKNKPYGAFYVARRCFLDIRGNHPENGGVDILQMMSTGESPTENHSPHVILTMETELEYGACFSVYEHCSLFVFPPPPPPNS